MANIESWIEHKPFTGEQGYLDLLRLIRDQGVDHSTRRTGEMTRGVYSQQLHFYLNEGLPLITTKKVPWGLVAGELLWFIEGGYKTAGRMDDNRLLELSNSFGGKPKEDTIWTANGEAPSWQPKAEFEGDLGRIYGSQWRSWQTPDGRTIDQLKNMLDRLKRDPSDRRAFVSAWNPGEFDQMSLPPCHVSFQVKILEEQLGLMMYQRSADMFLGVPFNIASYSLLAHMIGQVVGAVPTLLTINIGDAHIYKNHFDQVEEQLGREILPPPKLELDSSVNDIDSFKPEHIKLIDYKSHAAIKAPMAVDK